MNYIHEASFYAAKKNAEYIQAAYKYYLTEIKKSANRLFPAPRLYS